MCIRDSTLSVDGLSITSGSNHVFVGSQAGDGFDTESNNMGIGVGALGGSVAGGEYNVAVGNYTLDALTSGDNNVAIGYNAGSSITEAGANTLIGFHAGLSLTTGQFSTFIGGQAGDGHDTESNNLGVGYDALGGAVDGGEFNVSIGNSTLDALTSGDYLSLIHI